MTEVVAVCRVAAVRLEELDPVARRILEATRVVQQLADGEAFGDRAGIRVELEQTVRHELEDERRHERLRDARDPEPVCWRQRLARLHVRDACRRRDVSGRPQRDDRDSRNSGREDGFEVLFDQRDEPNPLGSVPHQERSRGPAPELARQPA
jgi:hypothetical protein